MDYSFIKECQKVIRDNPKAEQDKAYESLIKFLYHLKLKGKAKARQIDEYDGETLFGNTTLIPGNIYIFLYKAENPTLYDDGKIKFMFYDSMPIVLVTHTQNKVIRGINLNLCNPALRAGVINTLHNLDLQFYNRGGMLMAGKQQAPISQSVSKTFLDPQKEKMFIDAIAQEYKLKNTNVLIRNYNIDRIQQIRMVENWQHKYIPFLTYTGEVKQDVLQLIWKVCGMDALTL
jgi:hypothetical protein